MERDRVAVINERDSEHLRRTCRRRAPDRAEKTDGVHVDAAPRSADPQNALRRESGGKATLHGGAAARFRVDPGTSRRDAAWRRRAGARCGHGRGTREVPASLSAFLEP